MATVIIDIVRIFIRMLTQLLCGVLYYKKKSLHPILGQLEVDVLH